MWVYFKDILPGYFLWIRSLIKGISDHIVYSTPAKLENSGVLIITLQPMLLRGVLIGFFLQLQYAIPGKHDPLFWVLNSLSLILNPKSLI